MNLRQAAARTEKLRTDIIFDVADDDDTESLDVIVRHSVAAELHLQAATAALQLAHAQLLLAEQAIARAAREAGG